jgi:hypothetical protein
MALVMDKMKEIKCYCGHTITCDCEPLKKQTAVEWLIEQLTPSISLQQKHIDELKEKAKEMEKQLIIETFKYAQILHAMGDEMRAEQYYYNLTNIKNESKRIKNR